MLRKDRDADSYLYSQMIHSFVTVIFFTESGKRLDQYEKKNANNIDKDQTKQHINNIEHTVVILMY